MAIRLIEVDNLGYGSMLDAASGKVVFRSRVNKFRFKPGVNLNVGSATPVQFDGVPLIDDGVVSLGVGGIEFTVANDCRMEIAGALSLRRKNSPRTYRTNIRFFWEYNGAIVSPYYQANYLRDFNSHDEVSQAFSPLVLDVHAGGVLQLLSVRVSGRAGTIQPDQGCVNAIVMRTI
jgi:hypothetical protein